MEKIDITRIFVDHFKTLKHFSSEKFSWADAVTFYFAPLAISLLVGRHVSFQFMASQNTDLITFYSVFGGFLLNLLVLIYGYNLDSFVNKYLAKVVLTEVIANISYLIALSVILVFVLFVLKVTVAVGSPQWMSSAVPVVKYITISGLIFVFIHFCLTICMVLKRFYSLSSNRK